MNCNNLILPARGLTHPVVAYEITQKTPIFNIITLFFNIFYRACHASDCGFRPFPNSGIEPANAGYRHHFTTVNFAPPIADAISENELQ